MMMMILMMSPVFNRTSPTLKKRPHFPWPATDLDARGHLRLLMFEAMKRLR